MLAIERRNAILNELMENKKVLVGELGALFDVSEETIRRDLEKLESEGLVKKTYGGAVLNEGFNKDFSHNSRHKANVSAKQAIAELILPMVKDGDTVILDSSTTSLFVARSIKVRRNLTVITNSLEIVLELNDRKGWKVFSTGGQLKEGAAYFTGALAFDMLSRYNGNLAVFSVKALDIERGMTDSNEWDARFKTAIAKSASRVVLAVDSSKFNRLSFVKAGDFSDIDVMVTEKAPDSAWIEKMKEEKVALIWPDL